MLLFSRYTEPIKDLKADQSSQTTCMRSVVDVSDWSQKRVQMCCLDGHFTVAGLRLVPQYIYVDIRSNPTRNCIMSI